MGYHFTLYTTLPQLRGSFFALLLIVIGLGWSPPTVQAEPAALNVLINEIHYNPDIKSEQVEFIELYNPTAQPIDLFQWTISGGIDFFFPRGSSIPANGFVVIAQNPAALQSKFGIAALGPYVRTLSSDGDEIILNDNQAAVVDQMRYGLGFPWPIVGDAPGHSIQLIQPTLDNEQASSWRSGWPTPGWFNSTLVDNPPPALAAISHSPQMPTEADRVRITAKVSDQDGVREVVIFYQLVAPGQYIRLDSLQYARNWTPLPMQRVDDQTFVVDMPPEVQRHRHLVRYRVQAVDNTGRSVTAPYLDDPQPNFAYFVYNGVPPWRGAIKPGSPNELGLIRTYDFNLMRPLPVYHLLANLTDVVDAQFIPNSGRLNGYMGDDYPWHGTLIYNGQVYDHIGFRARGGMHRYSVGKNMWKFNFLRGHRFQAYDDFGQPYPVKWDKLNFSAAIQHASRLHRGEHGLFEALGFRLFNLADVEASNTHYVHFRVVDEEREYSGQYFGDFWGLYLAIQEIDGHWLDQHQLPDGNIYKMENWTGELNNQGLFGPSDKSDLNAFMGAYSYGSPDVNWWRQHFDLDRYYSFRAITEFIHHYDQDQGKNYHYYQNPETGRWSVYPWDLDLTWADNMFGEGAEPFRDRVLPHPELQIAYQNRLRELRDLLFNSDQMFPLINEYAALIDTASNGRSMVDADRFMWDYNPILRSRYTEGERAGNGKFYFKPPSHDFPGMLQLMRDWVVQRGNWIDQRLLTDNLLPSTPTVSYVGPANYPADQLRLQSSGFGDANGAFAAMQWRAAEISWPGVPGYQPNAPNQYEIEGGWQSAELTTFTPAITVPTGVCRVGHLCRVRVRMKNNLGRWSHWSAPAEFLVGSPSETLAGRLQLTELMYHPPLSGYIPDSDFEFIELKNVSATAVDLSNLRFSSGISYTFPSGAQLAPGAYLVLAKSRQWFQARYGFAPFAEYNDRLNDKGEGVTLVDAFGRAVLSLTYSDSEPWPKAADGEGFSLVLQNPDQGQDINQPANWQSSAFSGGSPGSDEPVAVVINEVLTRPLADQAAAVELYNPTSRPAAIGNWYLTNNAATPQQFKLPADTVIPPGGYLVLTSATLGFELSPTAPAIYLFAAYPGGKLANYRTSFVLAPTPAGVSLGRYTDSLGLGHFVPQQAPSLGEANSGPLVGPVVISGIHYRAADGVELIELTNITAEPVKLYDPLQPANTWQLQGLFYPLPSGVELPAYGKLLLATQNPDQVCNSRSLPAGTRVLGPLPRPLIDNEQYLALLRPEPGANPGAALYIPVDEVQYRNSLPWPGLDGNNWLVRKALNGYGNDPINWQASSAPLAAEAGVAPAMTTVCSFAILPRADGGFAAAWVTSTEADVTGFNLWRSADGLRANAEQINPTVVAAQEGSSTGAEYSVQDATAQPGVTYTYWLQAVNSAGESSDLLFTTPQLPVTQTHLPVVER